MKKEVKKLNKWLLEGEKKHPKNKELRETLWQSHQDVVQKNLNISGIDWQKCGATENQIEALEKQKLEKLEKLYYNEELAIDLLYMNQFNKDVGSKSSTGLKTAFRNFNKNEKFKIEHQGLNFQINIFKIELEFLKKLDGKNTDVAKAKKALDKKIDALNKKSEKLEEKSLTNNKKQIDLLNNTIQIDEKREVNRPQKIYNTYYKNKNKETIKKIETEIKQEEIKKAKPEQIKHEKKSLSKHEAKLTDETLKPQESKTLKTPESSTAKSEHAKSDKLQKAEKLSIKKKIKSKVAVASAKMQKVEAIEVDKLDDDLLYAACKNKNLELVNSLIAKGANCKVINTEKKTLFHGLLENLDYNNTKEAKEIAKILIKNGANINDKRAITQPLTIAIRNKNVDFAQFLIENGADLNTPEVYYIDEKYTPLQLVFTDHHYNFKLAKTILENGGNTREKAFRNHLEKNKSTLFAEFYLNHYRFSDEKEIHELMDTWIEKAGVEMLKEPINQHGSIMHIECKTDDSRILENLCKKGVNINQKNSHGYTPLHYSINSISNASILIKNGANIHAKDNSGKTPLHLVANLNNIKMAELLLNNDAKIDEKNRRGYTPLLIAAEKGNIEMAKFLIDRGANINAEIKGIMNDTITRIALHAGHIDFLTNLQEDGYLDELKENVRYKLNDGTMLEVGKPKEKQQKTKTIEHKKQFLSKEKEEIKSDKEAIKKVEQKEKEEKKEKKEKKGKKEKEKKKESSFIQSGELEVLFPQTQDQLQKLWNFTTAFTPKINFKNLKTDFLQKIKNLLPYVFTTLSATSLYFSMEQSIALSDNLKMYGLFPTRTFEDIGFLVDDLLYVWQDYPELGIAVTASAIALVAGVVAIVMNAMSKESEKGEIER